MNVQHRLSVVITLYNKGAVIERALRSLQLQTMRDFEIIVIDDGSTDDGPQKVKAFGDARIRMIGKPNGGLASARNRGIAESRTELVCFLDADDELLPDHLKHMDALHAAVPDAALLLTAYWVDRGKGMRRRISLPRRFYKKSGEIPAYFSMPEGKGLLAGVLKKQAEALGGFRQMFAEDVDFFLRSAALHPVAYSPNPTMVWHLDVPNRMCTTQEVSRVPHQPGGGLMQSFAFLETSPGVRVETLSRVKSYLAQKERKAIVATLLSGDREQARSLTETWQKTFGVEDRKLLSLLQAPDFFLTIANKSEKLLSKLSSVLGYCRDWIPSKRIFAILARPNLPSPERSIGGKS